MNATSTSKVVQMGIKRKSAVTIVGTASKWSKDDEEEEHDIDNHSFTKESSTRKC